MDTAQRPAKLRWKEMARRHQPREMIEKLGHRQERFAEREGNLPKARMGGKHHGKRGGHDEDGKDRARPSRQTH